MRTTELTGRIRAKYTAKRGYGIAKVADPEYQNIWFVVPPAPPKQPPSELPVAALRRAYEVQEQIPEVGAEDDLDRFIALLFRRREALSSSRMEGTWSTIDHVLTPTENLESHDARSETASIRGYAAALESNVATVLNERYEVFTTEFVQSLHEMILSKDPTFDGTPGAIRSPGEYRSIVQIGGLRKEDSVYNPTPADHVMRCFSEVMSWYRDDLLAESGDMGLNGMTLAIRLAIGHSHFEAVHPFQDGNGRVGRMLWPFQMLLAGVAPLYLSGFVEAHNSAYNESLEIAQKQLDYVPMISFICEAMASSHAEANVTKTALQQLPTTWSGRAKFRKGSTAQRALPLLIKSPIITANELKNELKVSFEASNNALKALTNAGVIRERTGDGRNRIFAAEEVLELIGRPFGEKVDAALKRAHAILFNS